MTLVYSVPFVIFGLLLAVIASVTYRGLLSTTTASLGAIGGMLPHLLGPAFDFPLVTPGQLFVAGGVTDLLVAGLLVIGYLTGRFRE